MDFTVVAVSVFAGLIFLGIFGLAYAVFVRPRNLGDRVWTPGEDAVEKRWFDWRRYVKGSERVFKPLGEMIPRSPEEMSRQERRLMQAGIRRKDGPVLFYGIKLGLAITLFVGFAVAGYVEKNPLLYVILPVLLGALLPDIWMTHRIRSRKEDIQLAIPDALDLTVVCIEAGLGLDQSLMRIGQEIKEVHPALSEELKLMTLEVNAGRTRAQALRNLSTRTEVDDLKALVAVLIQTDRFGTSIAQSLRVFSDALRTKRKQRAEERAAKTTIKMIPPLVFFILPAIFVVVLGPAIITLIRSFIPALGGN